MNYNLNLSSFLYNRFLIVFWQCLFEVVMSDCWGHFSKVILLVKPWITLYLENKASNLQVMTGPVTFHAHLCFCLFCYLNCVQESQNHESKALIRKIFRNDLSKLEKSKFNFKEILKSESLQRFLSNILRYAK